MKSLIRSQKGMLHLSTLLPLALVMVAVGGIGAYVLTKSKAATSTPLVVSTYGAKGEGKVSAIDVNSKLSTLLASGITSTDGYTNNPIIGLASYSPDKKTIAIQKSGNPTSAGSWVQLYDIATKTSKDVALPTGESFSNGSGAIAWYPDSSKLVFQTWNSNTTTYSMWTMPKSVTAGAITKLPVNAGTGFSSTVRDYEVLSDGSAIVYLYGNQDYSAPGTEVIYQVIPGQQPVKLFDTPGCSNIVPTNRPSKTFALTCNVLAGKTQTYSVKKYTLGTTAPVTLYTSSFDSSSRRQNYTGINDIAFSSDDATIAATAITNAFGDTTALCDNPKNTRQEKLITFVNGTKASKPVTSWSGTAVQVRCLGAAGDTENTIKWEPDGPGVAFAHNAELRFITSTTRGTVSTLQAVQDPALQISW